MRRSSSPFSLARGLGLIALVVCTGPAACGDDTKAEREAPAPEPGDASPAVEAGSTADAATPTDAAAAPSADALLLDEIQKTTFRYFWDFAHPVSGMARERSTSGDVTTTGGTGFGVQAIVVAVSRGWITRAEAVTRLSKVVAFLGTADRFHGAWSHWVDGKNGKTVPFSAKDDGGDLVETTLLLSGLLTARAYFDGASTEETALRSAITTLWEGVDFSWYVHDGALFWHWSPTYAWQMNLPIRGWNEALVTYVLALGSPTHAVAQSVYTQGFVSPTFANNGTFEGYQLPLGPAYGGPLFLAHYSFLGLDPRKMADTHASYWYQNVVHTRINRAYCVSSAPKDHGYGPALWGLTASDNPTGYDAHSPTNDNGTIAPTAALSSMPYTPHESLLVARHLRTLGPKAFGEHGFVDALNPKQGWFDAQVIAIDQGPIVVMLENYRSGLVWRLLMGVPEVKSGLARAAIAEPDHATGFHLAVPDVVDGRVHLVRHPDRGGYELDVAIHDAGAYSLVVETAAGVDAGVIWNAAPQKKGQLVVDLGALAPGKYTVRLGGAGVNKTLPIELH